MENGLSTRVSHGAVHQRKRSRSLLKSEMKKKMSPLVIYHERKRSKEMSGIRNYPSRFIYQILNAVGRRCLGKGTRALDSQTNEPRAGLRGEC